MTMVAVRQRTSTPASGRARHAIASLLFCLLLAGCHKKVIVAPLPPPPVPPAIVSVPPPTHPTEPEPKPEVVVEAPIPTPPPPPPRRIPRRRTTPPPVTTAPTTTAAATPAPVDLGQLTTGGEATNTALRQTTEDLLRTQQKRLIALPSALSLLYSEQVERARLFLRDADDAWKKVDIEGARNLATKAKILLDEITK